MGGYGLWVLVAINSAIFIIFALSFFHPKTKRDWRAMGVFSAFVVALLTEMYGFPLTMCLVSGWLGSRFPALDLTHNGDHLADLIGWKGDPHLSPFHLASYIAIGGGFWLISAAWTQLGLSLSRKEKPPRILPPGLFAGPWAIASREISNGRSDLITRPPSSRASG